MNKIEPTFDDDFGDIASLRNDGINPSHYKSHPSGVECIQITQSMSFCLGNAVKYIWRADLKHDDNGVEDLLKAEWYIKREIQRRQESDT